MKTIIAGTRSFSDYSLLEEVMDEVHSHFNVSEVVSGTAKGADRLGELWASERSVRLVKFPADWKKLGKAAGPIRNLEMAVYSELLVSFWDGASSGTKNMITHMESLSKPRLVVNYRTGHMSYTI